MISSRWCKMLLGANIMIYIAVAVANESVCTVPVDLGFLIDASTSVGLRNFQKILTFVGKIINGFDISEQGTHVGVITYSYDATVHINFETLLGDDLRKDTVISKLDKIQLQWGPTRIDKALKAAWKNLFTVRNGMRPNKPKIILMMTDGTQSWDADLEIISRPLKEMGVQVYSLGIGEKYNMTELESTASDEANIFLYEDFDSLSSIKSIADIVEKFCRNALEMCY